METNNTKDAKGTFRIKKGFAEMLKGGVIMDVVTAEHAKIAEKAGAVAVMALERVPADIRKAGGVARMADPKKIKEIMGAVTIPVMAKTLTSTRAKPDHPKYSILGFGVGVPGVFSVFLDMPPPF